MKLLFDLQFVFNLLTQYNSSNLICKYVFLFLICCREIRLQEISSKTSKFNILILDMMCIDSDRIIAIQFTQPVAV